MSPTEKAARRIVPSAAFAFLSVVGSTSGADENAAAIAVSPKDKNVVWVGTGEPAPRNDVSYGDGIYRTDDGGKNWTNLGLRRTSQISKILIDPRDPDTVLVAALGDPFADSDERGVFRTIDGGKTWSKTLFVGPSTGACDLDWDPRNPRVVYAGMWQFRRTQWRMQSGGPSDGLYKSTDAGRTGSGPFCAAFPG